MRSAFVPLLALVVAGGTSASHPKCGITPHFSPNYIFGGDDAAMHEFPWQIAFYAKYPVLGWRHTCGGAIIDENWILTAAHCVQEHIFRVGERIMLGAYNLSNLDGLFFYLIIIIITLCPTLKPDLRKLSSPYFI